MTIRTAQYGQAHSPANLVMLALGSILFAAIGIAQLVRR